MAVSMDNTMVAQMVYWLDGIKVVWWVVQMAESSEMYLAITLVGEMVGRWVGRTAGLMAMKTV